MRTTNASLKGFGRNRPALKGSALLSLLLAGALTLMGCSFFSLLVSPTATPEATSTPTLTPTWTSTTTPTPTLTPTNTPLPPTDTPTAVPPTISPGEIRIVFGSGATTATQDGVIQPGQVVDFLLGVSKDQPMMIAVDSRNSDVTLSVMGLKDGKVLLAATSKQASMQALAEESQDYLVQVYGGGSKENFSLRVTVPQRVKFQAGATSSVEKGVTTGGSVVTYVVRASAGQQMDLKLEAPNTDAVLEVSSFPDGNPYLRAADQAVKFSLKLPVSGDYIIAVVPKNNLEVNFTLNIAIK